MPSSNSNKTTSSRSKKSSRKTSKSRKQATVQASQKLLFWPIVALTFLLWVAYRSLFNLGVLFDETLGKAIFFGLPVWFFITMTRTQQIVDAFDVTKIKQGLLQGIAFGGIFGFVATLAKLYSSGASVEAAPLFASNTFWWEFFLALMTGFWETMFFFAFVMTMIQLLFKKWPLINQVLLTSLVFIIFHVPNLSILFSGGYFIGYLILIWAFSVGQAFLYARRQNAYTLVISHAIWGMVLLVHVAN
jgi:hypothetical protein